MYVQRYKSQIVAGEGFEPINLSDYESAVLPVKLPRIRVSGSAPERFLDSEIKLPSNMALTLLKERRLVLSCAFRFREP
jgi:hypothetical protein